MDNTGAHHAPSTDSLFELLVLVRERPTLLDSVQGVAVSQAWSVYIPEDRLPSPLLRGRYDIEGPALHQSRHEAVGKPAESSDQHCNRLSKLPT